MTIDYSSEDVYSSDSTFNGVDDNGNKFVIYANWNSWDESLMFPELSAFIFPKFVPSLKIKASENQTDITSFSKSFHATIFQFQWNLNFSQQLLF